MYKVCSKDILGMHTITLVSIIILLTLTCEMRVTVSLLNSRGAKYPQFNRKCCDRNASLTNCRTNAVINKVIY